MAHMTKHDKLKLIIGGLELAFQTLGTDFTSLPTDAQNSLGLTYLLIQQCLWARFTTDDEAKKFVLKHEKLADLSAKVLENNDLDDVVFTYRALHTNLLTQRGKGRHYALNRSTLTKYFTEILDGTLNVVAKTRKLHVPQPKVVQNSFLAKFVQPKVATKKTRKAQPKVANQMTSTIQQVEKPKNKWQEIALNSVQNTDFVKVVAKKNTVYGKIISDNGVVVVLQTRHSYQVVKNDDIVKVEKYSKE